MDTLMPEVREVALRRDLSTLSANMHVQRDIIVALGIIVSFLVGYTLKGTL